MSDDLVQELILEHQSYMRSLVRAIHKKLPSHVDFEELVSYGQVGLAEAARAFDPTRCVSFETYAYYRIRGAVFDGIRESTWLPPAMRRAMNAEAGANEVARTAAEAQGEAVTREQCATKFRDVVRKLGAVFLTAETLDAEASEQENTAGVDRLDLPEMGRRITRAVECLPERSQTVVRMHYLENQTFTQIGRVLSVHKSTIMRWHDAAIDELRAALEPPECQGRNSPATSVQRGG